MTPSQRAILMYYRDFRNSSPALTKLLRTLLPSWLVIFVVCGAMFGLAVASGVPFVAGVAGGLFAGVVARDIGWCLKTQNGWPTINEIIDWDRVEQLLNKNGAERLS